MAGMKMTVAEVERHQARVNGTPAPAAKPKRKGLRSKLEEDIAAQLARLDLPPFVTDYRFAPRTGVVSIKGPTDGGGAA